MAQISHSKVAGCVLNNRILSIIHFADLAQRPGDIVAELERFGVHNNLTLSIIHFADLAQRPKKVRLSAYGD